jgi:transposase
MKKSCLQIEANGPDRTQLLRWISAHGTPQQVVMRSRIILLASQGKPDTRIASELGINRHTCRLWRQRYIDQGVSGLWGIAPGRGKKPIYGPERVGEVIDATLQTKPKGQTHWSTRAMAKSQGISHTTVQRIWQMHNIKPHLTKAYKLSRDARFVEKLTDVVGVYLNPPDKAMVLCVDEKSQIQALDRTQPGLPLKKGRCGTLTHDYKRNGTTCLFAALNVLEGKVIGQCYARHRHQEFLKFLRKLDREFPKTVPLHLIMDNYGTHSHPKVQEWLKKHPRFSLHFIPTSSSWLNLVERWFRELTDKRVRRGIFYSVEDLKEAIQTFIQTWNEDPRPFVWTASVESILEKMGKCRKVLEGIKPGCTQPPQRKRKPHTQELYV